MGLAVRRPDLINKIVIMNTAAFTDTFIPLRIAVCRIPYVGEFAVRRLNLFVQAARFMATSKILGLSGQVLEGFLFPYRSFRDRVAIYRFVKDIPMKPEHISYPVIKEIEDKLQSLKDKKIVIIWGCRDFCFYDSFFRPVEKYFSRGRNFFV